MAPYVWLVTGSTSGIGAATVNEIVARGDKVIASGRKVEEKLGHLKSDNVALLELDIEADRSVLEAKIKEAWNIFGHIDALFNNAGVTMGKTAEESGDEYLSTIFNVNLFGQIRITQAILPLLRAQGHGVIAFTSSSSAWIPLPMMSSYSASKAALSAWVEVLHRELYGTGVKCTSIEPGGFPTLLGQPRTPGAEGFGEKKPDIAAYEPLFNEFIANFMENFSEIMCGDLKKCAARIVDIVKMEGMAAGKPWTVRIALGTDGMEAAEGKCKKQLQDSVERWRDVSVSTDSDGTKSRGFELVSKKYMA